MDGDIQGEIAQLETLMRTDRGQYERSGADARLLELYRAEEGTTQAPEPVAAPDDGLPVMLTAAEARAEGVADYAGYVVRHQAVADVLLAVEDGDRRAVAASFERLPATIASAAVDELTDRAPPAGGIASEAELARLATTRTGRALLDEWGDDAGQRLAVARARLERIGDRVGVAEAIKFDSWLDSLSMPAQLAVYRKLAG
jgi:hypothetical protein